MKSKKKTFGAGLALACVATLLGCATNRAGGPYEPPSAQNRNTLRAEELNREGADLIENDLSGAERSLRAALSADLYFGPAHNNLGVVFLKQEKLYEAAAEFEWAKKLMPGHPDPRMNLGIVLEQAMRAEDALAAYGSALEIYSEHLPSKQALARLQVETGRTDLRTKKLLEDIAMQGEDETWRAWARKNLGREELR